MNMLSKFKKHACLLLLLFIGITGANAQDITVKVCKGKTATLYEVDGSGNKTNANIEWYDSSGGVLLYTGKTMGVSTNSVWYAKKVDVSGSCPGEKTKITVIVVDLPAKPTANGVTICSGQTATLTASGGATTYYWYMQATGGSSVHTGSSYTTPALTANTTYYVSASNGDCESSRTEVKVTVNSIPSKPTVSGVTICSGQTATLTASGSGDIKWYTQATGGSSMHTGNSFTTPSLTVDTKYYVSASNGNCESDRTEVKVTVNSIPSKPTANGVTICSGETATLTASGSGDIKWYMQATGGSSVYTGNSYTTPALTANTTYYVSASNGSCESDRTAVQVTVTPIPSKPTVSGVTICSGETATLTASGSGDIKWYTQATGGSSMHTGNSFTTPSLTVDTKYYVSASNGNCESDRTEVKVTVNSIPSKPTANGVTICSGETATLTASGSGDIKWYMQATGGSSVYTGNSYTTPALTANTTYYVSASNGNCESDRTEVNVTVKPLPTPSISGNQTICSGSTSTLSVSGSYQTYKWSNGATTPTITINGGTYYVEVWTSDGCYGKSSNYTVTETSKTTPTFAQVGPYCEGDVVPALPTTSTNSITGTWSPSISSATGSTTYTFTPNAGECANTTTMTIVVNAKPTPSISGDQTVCSGMTTTLSVGTYDSYKWSNGATTPTITVGKGTYSVEVTKNGCSAKSANFTIGESAALTPMISGDQTVCSGTTTTLSVGAYDTYLWSNGATTPTITVGAGTYTVKVTKEGCSGTSAAYTVTESPKKTPTFAQVGPYCDGDVIPALPTTSTNSITGTWSPAIINATGSTTYTFTPNVGECANTTTMTIVVNAKPTPSISGDQTVCSGMTTTLSVGTYDSYKWSTGATTPTIVVGKGTYSVEVTKNGCSGKSADFTIGESAALTPMISGDQTVCSGMTTTLSVGTYDTYLWSNGATTPTITVGKGTYSVEVTKNGCSGKSANFTISESAALTPMISGDQTVCSGMTTTLSVGSYDTYLWSNGATTPTITVGAGTYTVEVTKSGCSGTSAAYTVTESAALTPTITGINTICVGTTTTLSVGTYDTYLWSNGATTSTITVSAGTYTVKVTKNGCSGTSAAFTVTETTKVTPTFTQVGPYCEGDVVPALPTTSTNSITGTWSPAISSATGSTTYTFTPNAGECANTTTMTVVVNAKPTPSISGDQTVCSGMTTTLSVGTYDTYLWSNGATTPTITVGKGTYSVEVTKNGCSGKSANFTIGESAALTPMISGDQTVCSGMTTTLSVGSYDTYLWSNGATTPTITVGAGTYTVEVTKSGCSGTSAAYTVTESAALTPTITGINTICVGTTTTLSVGTYDTYLWSNGATTPTITVGAGTYTVEVTKNGCSGTSAAFTVTETTKVTPTFTQVGSYCEGDVVPALPTTSTNSITGTWSPAISNATGSTTYTFTPNAGECANTTTMTIVVNAKPTPSISGDQTVCSGMTTTLSVGTYDTYLWSNGATTPTITVGKGTYSVEVTQNGCSGKSADFTIGESAALTPMISGDQTVCSGMTTTLSVGTYDTYLWSTGATTSTITIGAGSYTVSVTRSGCSGTSTAFTVTETAKVTPIFAQVGPYCDGDVVPALPTTSTNSITGTWSPAISSATGSTTYTFTPNAGECANTTTMTVVVNAKPTPSISGDQTVCSGMTTTLSVGTYDSYLWSNGATTPTITVGKGTYSVEVTQNGCSGKSADFTIGESAALTPMISGDQTVCSGMTTTLSVGTYDTYLWSNGATTPTITVGAGTYTVEVTKDGCSGTSSAYTVTESAALTPTITGINTICVGTTTTLSVGTYDTYLWSNGATTPTITVGAGTYTVEVTKEGCSGTSTAFTITETAKVTPTFTQVGPYCEGDVVPALPTTSTNSITGTWSPAISNATGSTTYTFTPNAGECANTTTMTIVVNAKPTPSISGDQTVCSGMTTTLSVGTYDTYLWSNGATTPTIIVGKGTYSVEVTQNGCSGKSADFTISESAALTPMIIGLNTICIGTTTTLSVGTYDTYLWSNGATTPTITVGAGTYTVEVTRSSCSGTSAAFTVTETTKVTPTFTQVGPYCDGDVIPALPTTSNEGISGTWSPAISNTTGSTTYTFTPNAGECANTTTMTVVVNAKPTPSISGDQTVCSGMTTTLSVGTYDSYLWSNGATTPTITVGKGTYSVEVTQNGCSAKSADFTINEKAALTPMISGDQTVCAGHTTTLSVGTYDTYLWSNGATTATITVGGGTYTVEVTKDGCSGTSSAYTVTESAALTPTITGINTICVGTTTTLSVGTYDTYLWSNGATTPTITVGAGTYTVEVTKNGCSGTSAAFTITETTKVTPTFAQVGPYCDGDVIPALSTTSNEGISGTWSPAISNTAGSTTYTFTPNAGECANTTTMTITVNETYEISSERTICTAALAGGYVWNGVTFTTADEKTVTLPTKNGCDSIVHMKLNVSDSYNIFDTVSICPDALPYEWKWREGTAATFIAADTKTVTLTAENGCDSIVNMTLILYPTYNEYDTISICPSALPYEWKWRGGTAATFTAADSKQVHLTSKYGCDSTVNMTLKLYDEYDKGNIFDTITICPNALPYEWKWREGSVTFTEAGTKTEKLQTIHGCDSIVNMTLELYKDYTGANAINISDTVCSSSLPYQWNPKGVSPIIFTEAGVKSATLQTQHSCDSIVNMTLVVKRSYDTIPGTRKICQNELPYDWDGDGTADFTQTTAGTFTERLNLTTYDGCDSIVTATLIVNPTYDKIYDTITVCPSSLPYEWLWREGIAATFTAADSKQVHLTSKYGCDSTVYMTLELYPNYTGAQAINVYDTICSSVLGTFRWNDSTFNDINTTPGFGKVDVMKTSYQKTKHGCDSTVNMHLHVKESYIISDTREICQNELPYDWDGDGTTDFTQTTAGSYTGIINLTSTNGCDSTVMATLVVNPTYSVIDPIEICDNELPFTWNGIKMEAGGVATAPLKTIKGCDSVVNLMLVVHPTYNDTIKATICEGDRYTENGFDVNTEGFHTRPLKTKYGCDSIVTVDLMVAKKTYGVDSIRACDSLKWIDGRTYYISNNTAKYTIKNGNAAGCDSIVSLKLYIGHTQRTYVDTIINYGQTYQDDLFTENTTGTYHGQTQTYDGCDSIVTLYLGVIPSIQMPDAIDPSDNALNMKTGRYRNQFGPIISGNDNEYEYNMTIFNRWNTTIFQANKPLGEAIDPIKHYWDGTYKGKVLHEDAFLYYIKIKVRIETLEKVYEKFYEKKGTVSIIYK